ncbi:MAG: class I SAM-dependent methyltransferase [Pseudomonadota bacterium]
MQQSSRNSSQIEEFVAQCDSLGGISDPRAADLIANFRLELDVDIDHVDQLDPFSDEYHALQMDIYQSVSGRVYCSDLDEQDKIVSDATNPHRAKNSRFLTMNSKPIINALALADLDPGAYALDMGAGRGFSSEVLAHNGVNVHALDLNPKFISYIKKTARQKGYAIEGILDNFDRMMLDQTYDMILFDDSMHFSSRLDALIPKLVPMLNPGGSILFIGEPIHSTWWKHWGVSMDATSVYSMRKFGKFNACWSKSYLKQLFDRAGLKLWIIAFVGRNNGYLGVAMPKGSADDALIKRRCAKIFPEHLIVFV